MITEIIAFEMREKTSKDQMIHQLDTVVHEFHKNQDGYVDMELVSDYSNQQWQMIIHYQSMDDIEKVKMNMPQSKALNDFRELIIPETMKVSFHEQHERWS